MRTNPVGTLVTGIFDLLCPAIAENHVFPTSNPAGQLVFWVISYCTSYFNILGDMFPLFDRTSTRDIAGTMLATRDAAGGSEVLQVERGVECVFSL